MIATTRWGAGGAGSRVARPAAESPVVTPASARWMLLLAGLALAAVAALASEGAIDASQSAIVATFRQEGVPVDAPFKRFSGTVLYNAAHPEAASAAVDVEPGGLAIRDESFNAELRKTPGFGSTHFPQATFRPGAFKPRRP